MSKTTSKFAPEVRERCRFDALELHRERASDRAAVTTNLATDSAHIDAVAIAEGVDDVQVVRNHHQVTIADKMIATA